MKDEVYQIVGAAMEVSNELGCGFLEAVYQESLAIELDVRQIPHVPQQRIAIFYKGSALYKEYIADFLCYDQIIVEIKAIKAITGIEEAQLLNYLKATNLPLGVIVNFGAPQLEWRRYANTKRDRQRTPVRTLPIIGVHSRAFAVQENGRQSEP
jgi:GxxExxY protein